MPRLFDTQTRWFEGKFEKGLEVKNPKAFCFFNHVLENLSRGHGIPKRRVSLFDGDLVTLGHSIQGAVVPPPPAPAEYADKHMPAGWWADAAKMEEGRKLFIGETNPDVNCASCHGKDGKPVKAGARDFRVSERMKLYSDAVWFWRISEGVPNTKMKAWKSKLSDEDRWKLVLYERNFGLAGKGWDEGKKAWVDAAAVSAAPAAAAPAAAPEAGK